MTPFWASVWLRALCLLLLWQDVGPRAAGISWRQESGFRWAELPTLQGKPAGFTLLPPGATGINFTNSLDEAASAANRILLNGAGLAAGDFDGDGLQDLFFCSLSGQSTLYRNVGGLRFQDVTQSSGLTLSKVVTRGAVFADINGDGWADLLVSTLNQGVFCYLNDGKGKFTDATVTAGTRSTFGSVTLALADVDGNGTLDLYVANYRSEDIRDRGQVDLMMVRGQMVVPPKLKDRLMVSRGQVIEYGEPDQLYLNDGKGRFSSMSWTNSAFLDEDGKRLTGPPLDWGLTASFRDINADGHPDLYVCNDYWTPDRIWINDGKGQFRALPRLAMRTSSSSSMGVDFSDLDRDGHLDFIVTDMLSRDPRLRKRQMPARWPIPEPILSIEFRPQIIQNTLFHNRGDGTFAEVANYAGVAASEWTWQPLFMDVDLDGYADLLVSAGHGRDVQDLDADREIRSRQRSWKGFTNAVERQRAYTAELMTHMRFYPSLEMPIFAFRNTGGLQFEEATAKWGTGQGGIHHCMAIADLDNDGDLDLAVNNLRSVATVYRNDTAAPRVQVRLKGLSPNTQGIGAHVTLRNGAVPMQSEEIIAGGRYMSGSEPSVVFGCGNAQSNMTVTVRWRTGRVSELAVAPNRIYEIDESAARETSSRPSGPKAVAPMQFEDVSAQLNHVHQDQLFDDLARQPLLYKRLSQLGPGVAWFDVNGDGFEDVVIGSGRGGQLAVFLNTGHGGFQRWVEPPFSLPVTRDQTGILGMRLPDGKALLLAGSANYEDGLAAGPAVRQYEVAQRRLDDSMPGQPSSTGPLALGDMDGDGELELFIGGRCLPGRYPEAAASLLLRRSSGRWQIDAEPTRLLRGVGLVSGAVWSDLDGDGLPELLLACEWGPVRVFKNQGGRFRDATADLGLERWSGWWSGIATADLDSDGKLDIVVSNWGLNSSYSASQQRPLNLYYADFFNSGKLDLIEAEFDPASGQDAPRRRLDSLAPVLPFLMERFTTHKAFSEATIATLTGANRPDLRKVQATTLASMAFFNRGNRFEAVPLPTEAQMAPAFAVVAADFNADGHEDVFLSQNFFDTEAENPRLDAGRGLLLAGNGKGGLHPIPGQDSGVKVYGEQRGAAACDYDQDGRVDLVVTQNSAATKLFRNTSPAKGLRVQLKGPPGNPSAVGAVLRLSAQGQLGPAREIQAGSGYWSQNSPVQVMASANAPDELVIRWPGGKVTKTTLSGEWREVTVDTTGAVSGKR
jgi:enediyne biosynthesis protein E4